MDNNGTELYNCPGCGARLDPTEADLARGYAACSYCKAQVRFKKRREDSTGRPVYVTVFRKPRGRGMALVATGGAALVLIIAVVFIWTMKAPRRPRASRTGTLKVSEGLAIPPGAVAITPETQTAFPIVCRGDRTMSIRNQSFKKDGAVLESGGSCAVFIDNATLVSGDGLLKITGNGSVKIENSNLAGKSFALWTSGSVSVIIGNSNITGETTAIHATGSSSVTITNCNLTAPVAASTSGNGSVVLVNTNVKGRTLGNILVQ